MYLGMSTCSSHPCSIMLFMYFLVLPSLLHSTIIIINARRACAQAVTYSTHSVCLCVCPPFSSSTQSLYSSLNMTTCFSPYLQGFQLTDFLRRPLSKVRALVFSTRRPFCTCTTERDCACNGWTFKVLCHSYTCKSRALGTLVLSFNWFILVIHAIGMHAFHNSQMKSVTVGRVLNA